jgi:cytoplasmic iron level regulating protein YaaA (DUF328/UPF0246 family)
MFLLLPPSEGKALGGEPRTKWAPGQGAFGRTLGPKRREIVDALAAAGGGDGALLGVKGGHLDRARHANASLKGSPTLPAARRYTGVVWDHLDLSSLPAKQRANALERIIVPSGLMGAVLASDPVPDYRLKMGARLAPFGTLSKWWLDSVSNAINSHCAGQIMIDLLPNEHRAAFCVDSDALHLSIRVDLVTRTGKAGGHDAKAAKGLLARHLLENARTITDARSLKTVLAKFTDQRFRCVTNVN